MTGSVLLTAPVILIFLAAQRVFQQDARGRGIVGQ
jgi:ABC-type glycerol-3-phosphate transport system permease component